MRDFGSKQISLVNQYMVALRYKGYAIMFIGLMIVAMLFSYFVFDSIFMVCGAGAAILASVKLLQGCNDDMESALAKLNRDGMITHDDRIRSDLFESWLVQHSQKGNVSSAVSSPNRTRTLCTVIVHDYNTTIHSSLSEIINPNGANRFCELDWREVKDNDVMMPVTLATIDTQEPVVISGPVDLETDTPLEMYYFMPEFKYIGEIRQCTSYADGSSIEGMYDDIGEDTQPYVVDGGLLPDYDEDEVDNVWRNNEQG